MQGSISTDDRLVAMRCVRTNIPGGFVITCSRREPRAACSSCHHREHEVLCDFELGGKKAGKTCDAKLCSLICGYQ